MRIHTILGLILISCASAQNETECPVYSCDSLDDGVCADKNPDGISINDNGCPFGQGCEFSAVAEWATLQNQTAPFMCQDLNVIAREGSLRFLQAVNATNATTVVNVTAPAAAPISTPANITTNATEPAPTPEQPSTIPANVTQNVTTSTTQPSTTLVNITTNATEPAPEQPTTIPVNVTQNVTTTTTTNATTISANATVPEGPAVNITANETEVITAFNCGSRNTQKNLEVGSHPKECTSSSADCVLKDGSISPCNCAPDGLRYCQPDRNSDAFDEFWQICLDGDMTIELYNNWTILVDNYVNLIEHPDCLEDIFPELKTAVLAAEEAGIEEDNYSMLLGLSGLLWIILLS